MEFEISGWERAGAMDRTSATQAVVLAEFAVMNGYQAAIVGQNGSARPWRTVLVELAVFELHQMTSVTHDGRQRGQRKFASVKTDATLVTINMSRR